MPILRVYAIFNGLLERACLIVACAGIAFAVVAMVASAFERVLIGFSFAVLNDLPPQLIPWVVFPMMGVLLRRERHITVDFLPAILTGQRRAMLEILVGLLVAAASIGFLMGGIEALQFFMRLNQRSDTGLNFPLWWIYTAFPTGFAILLWFAIEKCLGGVLELTGATGRLAILRGKAP